MSEIFLFGAGASVDAGIPTAVGMTKSIVGLFNKPQGSLAEYRHIVNFIIGGLLFRKGERDINPLAAGVDVEDLFNAVLLLSDRDSLEMSPFVNLWHPMVEAFDRVRPELPNVREIAEVFEEHFGPEASPSSMSRRYAADSLEKALNTALAYQEPESGKGINFKRVADRMIFCLADLVWVEDPASVAYMLPLISRAKRDKRLVVATLNYDNTVEMASESVGVSCNSGIEGWSENGICDFSGDGVQLIKLHGSIDWQWEEIKKTPERPFSRNGIRQVQIDAIRRYGDLGYLHEKPAVIFGHRNKLTPDGPFLELLRSFQHELSKADKLTVVGYSFRDPHINVSITNWLSDSTHNKLRIIDPNFRTWTDFDSLIWEFDILSRTNPKRFEIVREVAHKAFSNLESE